MLRRALFGCLFATALACNGGSSHPGGDSAVDATLQDTGQDATLQDVGQDATSSDTGQDAGPDAATNVCGDGVPMSPEPCDDGNAQNDDACLVGCVSARCGDGVVRTDISSGPGSETCDDGNGVDGDACPDGASGLCRPAACGDAVVRFGVEACDDGNTASGDGCSSTCQFETALCGNGTTNVGEQCDLGAMNSDNASGACPSVCRKNCSCPRCGDGVADFARGETCDDGNSVPGDGCDPQCAIERAPTCGDGTLDLVNDEECDDGNLLAGDGCDGACQFEPVGGTCGDNTVQTVERCDDGNLANGDGCNPTCNLDTMVTTLTSNVGGRALAVSDTEIFLGSCNAGPSANQCAIDKIDLVACFGTGACTPTRVIGGTCGAPVDGGVGTAVLGCLESMATDGTRLWFGDTHTLRELDLATSVVRTVAGERTHCGAVDGTGTSAYFHDLRGVTYHGGDVYLLDGCENVLRRFDPVTGVVVTLAGTRTPDPGVAQSGTNAYVCAVGGSCPATVSTDGYGLAAVFGSPRYLTADGAGNLFVVDTNGQSIRTVNLQTGWVGTLVGGLGYVDGVGSAVRVGRPRGIASDGTSVYWAEQNASTVRQAIIATASTTTLVGVRGCPGSQDGTGGDGTQDYSLQPAGTCATVSVGKPNFTNPLGGFAYHWRSGSLLLIESNRLRRIH